MTPATWGAGDEGTKDAAKEVRRANGSAPDGGMTSCKSKLSEEV